MHLFKPEIGVMGTNGIVGPGMGLAAGGGVPAKCKTDRVSVAFFGDGAVEQGVPRGDQPGRGLEPARALRVREQRVRYGGALRRRPATRTAARAAAYGVPGRWTATTWWRCARRRGSGRARARRRRPHPARVPHLSHPRTPRACARAGTGAGRRSRRGRRRARQALPRAGAGRWGATEVDSLAAVEAEVKRWPRSGEVGERPSRIRRRWRACVCWKLEVGSWRGAA